MKIEGAERQAILIFRGHESRKELAKEIEMKQCNRRKTKGQGHSS